MRELAESYLAWKAAGGVMPVPDSSSVSKGNLRKLTGKIQEVRMAIDGPGSLNEYLAAMGEASDSELAATVRHLAECHVLLAEQTQAGVLRTVGQAPMPVSRGPQTPLAPQKESGIHGGNFLDLDDGVVGL